MNMISAANRFQNLSKEARIARADSGLMVFAYFVGTLIFALGIMDVVSTEMGLAVGASESNPVVIGMMNVFGSFWIVPKMFLHGLLAYMVVWYPNRPTLWMMMVVNLITSIVVANNLAISMV